MSRDMSAYGLNDPIANLFSTEQERQEAKMPKIHEIPLTEIDDFPDHPFKVRMDEDMEQLVESIRERGIITPVTLRQKEDGRYELISGHRRRKACEIAGFDTIKAEIRELDRDEAILLMVDSNLQRSSILPSEKAFAYKMKLEAMKRKTGRPPKEDYVPVGHNSLPNARELLSQQSDDSATQIQRYVRLTELEPELLKMVDDGRIAIRPAVEISYLSREAQQDLIETIATEESTPSLAQALKMRAFAKEGRLNEDVILSIMTEQKGNQKRKFVIHYDRVQHFIPADYTDREAEDHVIKALEHYQRYLQRQRSDLSR